MAQDIAYDDSNLRRLFAEMEPKRRLQAIKGGFRKAANKVRKTAINNLRSSGIRTDRDLERGIRAIVFKRTAGFRVTIGTKKAGRNGKGEAGFHKNRQGLSKPILIWAEEGTQQRRTKAKQGSRLRADRKRSAHSTGRMRRYGFMAQTLSSTRETVAAEIHDLVTENIETVAKKYGCR